ncbi:MAG TPA: DEAD/DEAH box helicase [Opitutus sp.]|nr:DEAD/DEAH box helicase [Opitutus sp.]
MPSARPVSVPTSRRSSGAAEIKLPPATDWRTTDRDEINRRILRAREEQPRIRNLPPRHPIFSNFEVQSRSGLGYEVEVRDLAQRQFGCTCTDFRVNGLGTCKHVEAVLALLQAKSKKAWSAARRHGSPRIDLVPDPERNALLVERNLAALPRPLRRWFDAEGRMPTDSLPAFQAALGADASAVRLSVTIAPWLESLRLAEEKRQLRRDYEQKVHAGEYPAQETLVPLYPYQRDGMLHLAFTGRALLADEMGLGKTIQAIAACALLHRLGQARRVLVVTPASLKTEWEEQISRFTPLPLQIVFGPKAQRLRAYDAAPFFTLVNYEQMLADALDVNARLRPDIIVLDEAQRIKNWASKTAQAVKRLRSRHAFVLTGTPIENRLDELYSIVSFLDPKIFGPLFRFNREFYRLDDRGRPETYLRLQRVHERIRPIMLRRRKSDVEKELPSRTDRNLFIELSDEQRQDYAAHEQTVAQLVRLSKRRPLSPQQQQKLLRELALMRMLCDSPYILDRENRTCPKLDELERIFDEVFAAPDVKAIVFSEWEGMLELVRDLCRKYRLGHAWHTGSVPQQKRRAEIRLFKDDPNCRVFLSTDSGGVGLNLQNASVVINCDLPWNPAKLEQRIARAWRKHQKNAVTVLNLIAADTIEQRMLGTLDAKRTLAEGVLDLKGDLEEVPLRPGGQSFLQRLEQTLSATPAAPASSANVEAGPAQPRPPADPAAAFSQRAAALLGRRLVTCEERYPDADAAAADAPPPVVVVVVDRDAEAWQPRLTELFAGGRDGAAEPAPRLEVLDRATAQAIERLEAAGLIQSRIRATRHLHPSGVDVIAPLTDEENARAADWRRQAAKKVKLARILAAEDMADEAAHALREAVRLAGSAFAVEARAPTMPATPAAALAPPLRYRWGEAAGKLQPLVGGGEFALPALIDAVARALETPPRAN